MAATYPDTVLLSGFRQRIQRPVSCFALITGFEREAIVTDQPSGCVLGHQRDDPGALFFGDARFASGSETISQSIYTFGVVAVEAPSDGLWMAAHPLGDPGGA